MISAEQTDRLMELILGDEHTRQQAHLLLQSLGRHPLGDTPSILLEELAPSFTPARALILRRAFWKGMKQAERRGGIELVEAWTGHLDALGRDILARMERRKRKAWHGGVFVHFSTPTLIAIAWRVLEPLLETATDPVGRWLIAASVKELKDKRVLPEMVIRGLEDHIPKPEQVWLNFHGMNEALAYWYLTHRFEGVEDSD